MIKELFPFTHLIRRYLCILTNMHQFFTNKGSIRSVLQIVQDAIPGSCTIRSNRYVFLLQMRSVICLFGLHVVHQVDKDSV